MNEEQIAKAREAKSAEELLALAKENGMEMTEEEAADLYNRLHSSTELTDEELENVAGGGCGTSTTKVDGVSYPTVYGDTTCITGNYEYNGSTYFGKRVDDGTCVWCKHFTPESGNSGYIGYCNIPF